MLNLNGTSDSTYNNGHISSGTRQKPLFTSTEDKCAKHSCSYCNRTRTRVSPKSVIISVPVYLLTAGSLKGKNQTYKVRERRSHVWFCRCPDVPCGLTTLPMSVWIYVCRYEYICVLPYPFISVQKTFGPIFFPSFSPSFLSSLPPLSLPTSLLLLLLPLLPTSLSTPYCY